MVMAYCFKSMVPLSTMTCPSGCASLSMPVGGDGKLSLHQPYLTIRGGPIALKSGRHKDVSYFVPVKLWCDLRLAPL